MQAEIKTWLYDISVAVDEIDLFVSGDDYSFETYTKDLKTRKAVERNLGIIGEAINRILLMDDTIAISNPRKIVDTRNRIIHGYETVSNEVIWDIIKKRLPLLKSEVEVLLQKNED